MAGRRLSRVFVDDSKNIRAIARGAALKSGKRLAIFRDGREALEGIRGMTGRVEVVTDLMMPRLNGFGLARELKERPDTRVVLCSNFPGSERERIGSVAREVGIERVLPKDNLFDALGEIGVESASFRVVTQNRNVLTTDAEKVVIALSVPIMLVDLIQGVRLIEGDRRLFIVAPSAVHASIGQVLNLLRGEDKVEFADTLANATIVIALSSPGAGLENGVMDVRQYLLAHNSIAIHDLGHKRAEFDRVLAEAV